MKDEIIKPETSKLSFEKGFNGYVDSAYLHDTTSDEEFADEEWETIMEQNPNMFEFVGYAPTQSLLQRWLREKHLIMVNVAPFWSRGGNRKYSAANSFDKPHEKAFRTKAFDTYEEALEEGLQKALKTL